MWELTQVLFDQHFTLETGLALEECIFKMQYLLALYQFNPDLFLYCSTTS